MHEGDFLDGGKDTKFDRLFSDMSKILQNESILRDTFVPETLVARDNQTTEIAHHMNPILRSGDPGNIFIWGDTGVGKTITVKYVLNVLCEGIRDRGLDIMIDTITIDCTTINTDLSVFINVLEYLNGTNVKQGMYPFQYTDEIWKLIDLKAANHRFYVLILFFDEIDRYDNAFTILYQFSRALAHHKIKSSNVAIEIIAASNKRNYLDTLDPKVLSSARFRFCFFPDYNEDELFQILQLRKGAFVDGSVSDEVLHFCAKNVADRYHGDARHAIDILYEAAILATEADVPYLSVLHIDTAEKIVNDRVTLYELRKISLHDKILLLAVYKASEYIRDVSKFPPSTSTVLEAYRKICEITSTPTNTDNHMSHRIRELDNKQLIQADYIRGHGNTKFIVVPDDIGRVVTRLFPPEFLQKLKDNECDIESAVCSKIRRYRTQ